MLGSNSKKNRLLRVLQNSSVIEVLGIIPARGGSKAIPRKNLVPLLGRPLIVYTCDAALRSKLLSRVIVSTDDEEIASVTRAAGIEAPFLRPSALAEDSTPMIAVVEHALTALAPYHPHVIVLLQPTSPLRTSEHIDGAIRLLTESDADTVVTVVEVPHQFNPVSVMRMKDGLLTPYTEGPQILRRQDKPRIYARNGPAVLVARRSVVERGGLYGERIRALEMSKMDSIDIDDAEDLVLAELWLSRRKNG